MKRTGLPIVLAFAAAFCASKGQGIEPAVPTGIIVRSEPSGAEVFLRDSSLGTTPLRLEAAFSDTLILFYPSRNTWGSQRSVLHPPYLKNTEGVVVARFIATIVVNSLPSGAAVFSGDSLLGRTPVAVAIPGSGGRLRVSRPGYADKFPEVTGEAGERVLVVLDPANGEATNERLSRQPGSFRIPGSSLLIPAAAGLTSGVLSVILKQKADSYYDDYLVTGDEALLKKTRRTDVYSGIALAVLELSFAYFIYLLFIGD
jgi:hypothetical protein